MRKRWLRKRSNGPPRQARRLPITRQEPAEWASTNPGWSTAQLRVCGIRRLRVADASVKPSIIRVHTHALGVLIGEKAADLIRNL
jgi:hypothetical protein